MQDRYLPEDTPNSWKSGLDAPCTEELAEPTGVPQEELGETKSPEHPPPDSPKAAPKVAATPVSPVQKPSQLPAQELSKDAIDKRLRRVFQPRSDGTYLVSQDFVDKYLKKGSDRDALLVMFEKCNYQADQCWQTQHCSAHVWKNHQVKIVNGAFGKPSAFESHLHPNDCSPLGHFRHAMQEDHAGN